MPDVSWGVIECPKCDGKGKEYYVPSGKKGDEIAYIWTSVVWSDKSRPCPTCQGQKYVKINIESLNKATLGKEHTDTE